ncbi:olfactory receptor 1509-like [Megalops cyprinoides]|uniref:olfactory receptor 1509-like n=1 Tax=Megalops cyprinoides TaxID=118141 RepID=UPI001865660D|nr:olfactory receptor 1509-like [Megalops cyprinoides]
MENASVVTSFVLIPYYEMEDLKYLYFATFLLLYLITVVLNFVLIAVICVDRALHEPMYIFLCNMAFNGVIESSSLLPSLLSNLLSQSHEVSLICCQAQSFSLHTSTSAEYTILTVMGYDRYVAICYPLQYHSIMSLSKVYKLIAFSRLYSLIGFTLLFIMTIQLKYCKNIIDELYCTNHSLLKLSCTDTSIENFFGGLSIVLFISPQVILILYSYAHILRVCLRSSKESQMKALKTCTPHLLTMMNYSFGCLFQLSQSRFNMSHVNYRFRRFMSLYFLIIPPVINPAIYGMNIQSIRCVLSPLLYSLFTHDCKATHSSNTAIKFADDTTIIGCITDGDKSAYRAEVRALTSWCQDNNLLLNVSKIKELIVDYRGLQAHQGNSSGEGVVMEAARQRLFFLRRLRRFGMDSRILTNFYRCTIESILTGSITAWYGSCTVLDRKALQRVVRLAQRITRTELPAIQDLYSQRCRRKAQRILSDHSHSTHSLFMLLPSGRRYRSIRNRTSRFRDSFYQQAIRLLNC